MVLLCLWFHTFYVSQLFLLNWGAIIGTERTKYVYNQDAVCSVGGPVLLLCLCLGPLCLSHLIFPMSLCIHFQGGSDSLIIIIKHFLCSSLSYRFALFLSCQTRLCADFVMGIFITISWHSGTQYQQGAL